MRFLWRSLWTAATILTFWIGYTYLFGTETVTADLIVETLAPMMRSLSALVANMFSS